MTNRRALVAILGAVQLMTTTACASRSRHAGPHELRFLALGDSYTVGEGVSTDDRWPERVAATLRGQSVRVGKPLVIARTGWTTDELRAAMDVAHPQGPFDLVTLLIGVNDEYRGHPVVAF